MPKAVIKKAAQTKVPEKSISVYDMDDDDDDDGPDSPTSQKSNDTPSLPTKGQKRTHDDENNKPVDFGLEVQDMLQCFGADISKTVFAKRKRLESFTNASLKASNKKVEEIWKGQHVERVKLSDQYRQQVGSVLQQWDTDLEKGKEQEEKLQNLFKQQQKLFQQSRIVQNQRLKTIRHLHDQFIKGMGELERCHSDQHGSVQGELKKEMALLQKKILMDTQQQEMANVRKSLHSMLF